MHLYIYNVEDQKPSKPSFSHTQQDICDTEGITKHTFLH